MKKKKLYEGNTKRKYSVDKEDQILLEFKDDIGIADEGKKKIIKGKGAICSEISSFLFQYLESYHIPTHFIRRLEDREVLVKQLEIIPVEILVRNIAAGNLVKQFNIEEGKELECPITEYYLKDSENQDSMINLDHVFAFGHATSEEMFSIQRTASKVNAILKDFFRRRSLSLVDIRLEFGRYKNKILLGDEISPNSCRLWDLSTGERYEENVFCQDVKNAGDKYQELRRLIFREI